jgi:tetratricopeptide (TPR) repeat protein
MTKATMPALDALQKALKASPNHPGSLILKARIEIANNQRDDAAKTLKLATTAGLAKASRSERGQAYSALGQLALANGNNNEARKQFEQALKINPRDDEALLGLGDLHFSSRVYSEALKYYQQARGLNSSQVPPALKVARTFIAMRTFTRAQRVLVEIRKIAPQAPEIIFLLGMVEASANNLDNAETHFNAAIKKKPTYFMPYLHLSRLHLKRNKPVEAMAVLKAAGEQLSGSPLVRNAEGEVLLVTKQLESAQAKFEEALRLDPNLNKALFNLGVSLLRLGELDKAQQKMDALKAKDREFPGLWEQLGALYVARKEYAKADSAYDLALKDEAPSEALRLAASLGYNLAGKHEKSIVQTAEVIKTNPGQAYARALRAEAYLLKGDKDEALIQIRQAAGREKTVYIMMIKGRVHEKRGEKADAVEAYSDVLKIDPQRNDVRFMRGRLLISTGAIKEGIKTLIEVIKNDPNMAQAHLWLGIGYAEANRELKALASYKAAVAKDPKLGRAHSLLGQVLFDRRSFRPALTALKKAMALGKEGDDWLANASYYLGESAFKLNQKKIAAEAYYRFKKLDPNSALVREVNKQLRSMGLPLRKPTE